MMVLMTMMMIVISSIVIGIIIIGVRGGRGIGIRLEDVAICVVSLRSRVTQFGTILKSVTIGVHIVWVGWVVGIYFRAIQQPHQPER
jgi:hypothetical protein